MTTASDSLLSRARSHHLHLFGGEEVRIRFGNPEANEPSVSAHVANISLSATGPVLEATGNAIQDVIGQTHSEAKHAANAIRSEGLWWLPRWGHGHVLTPAVSTNQSYDISVFPVAAIGGIAAHGVHHFKLRAGDAVAVEHMLDPTVHTTYTRIRVSDLTISGQAAVLHRFGSLLADLTRRSLADNHLLPPWQLGGASQAANNPGASTTIQPNNSP